MSGDSRDFNNIETRATVKFLFLQGKAPKEIHAILTEILACFLPGRAKDLSAPLYQHQEQAFEAVYLTGRSCSGSNCRDGVFNGYFPQILRHNYALSSNVFVFFFLCGLLKGAVTI